MSDKAYFEQAEQNIKLLLADKKFQEAYRTCGILIDKFPNEKIFIKLKEKIEDEVEKENEDTIEKKIELTEPLWKEEKYPEILKTLKPLVKLAPKNEKLKRLIYKAQEDYKEKVESLKKGFKSSQKKRLDELLKNNNPKLLDELFALEKGSPGNKDILELTRYYRDKMIETKIKDKQDLIYSDKFDAIENFLSQLRKIDDKNKRVEELEKFIKIQQHGIQIEQKGEFVFSAENHLLTLMKLKKYDKAMQVASEILEYDKSNEKIYKILKKAERGLFEQTRAESVNIITKNLPNLKEEYEKDKSNFIKI